MKTLQRALSALALALTCTPTLAVDELRVATGIALTTGGETLATARYAEGFSESVRSGGLLHLWTGLAYRHGGLVVLGTVGYQVDETWFSSNGASFRRVPLELLAFWRVDNRWRLGGGLRKATLARYTPDGAWDGDTLALDSSLGWVLQAEYFPAGQPLGLYGRFVAETYRTPEQRFRGDHVGAGLTLRF